MLKTSDGVSIAYYDIGRGAPLVALPYIPWSDVRSEFVAMNFKFHPRLAAEHRGGPLAARSRRLLTGRFAT